MSVNKRRGKYKTAKEFEQDKLSENFVSKTQLKNQALDLKKFGLELTKLRRGVIEKLPISEVTLKSLLDFEKMTTNLARKRHLMFIGKCLRSENELEIREYLDNKEKANISTMQLKASEQQIVDSTTSEVNNELSELTEAAHFIESLLTADGEKIELVLAKYIQLERQVFRQKIRSCNSAKDETKKKIATDKLLEYLRLNGITDFS